MRWLVVCCDHVGRVPPSHRGWRALHHHQPDGGLGRLWVGGVLLGWIFAPAVVHDTRYQEDQEQDNVAGDEDAKVQSDGVDLLVVFQKAHGACFMLGGPEASKNSQRPLKDGKVEGTDGPLQTEKQAGDSRAFSQSILFNLSLAPRPPPLPSSILSASLLSPTSRFQMSAVDTWLCGKNTLILATPSNLEFLRSMAHFNNLSLSCNSATVTDSVLYHLLASVH